MHTQFLRQVASVFTGDNLDEYTFVFPNRRSSLFFRKYLGEQKKTPFFAPKIFTIDKLFDYLSEYELLDDLSLIFRLWKTYRQKQKEALLKAGKKEEEMNLEEIDDFFLWGKIILSDFNDIDQYMVDASGLFTNLEEFNQLKIEPSDYLSEEQIRALGRISQLSRNLTEKDKVKRKFFDVWNLLFPLYSDFRRSLQDDGVAYPAMQARLVAEEVLKTGRGESDVLEIKLSALGKVVFIGLSAPTECEKVVMRYFQKRGGLFFWDYYSKMLKDGQDDPSNVQINRASSLIYKCVKEFAQTRTLLENGGCEEGNCNFFQIPASGSTEQAVIANELLKTIQKEGADAIETAVVVSDETLLLPLLEIIGQKDFNITMGYPLKATSTSAFIFSLFDFHLRSQITEEGTLFPGDILKSLLGHPFIKEICPQSASKAAEYIQKSNLYLVAESEFDSDRPFGLDKDSSLVKFLKLIVPNESMYSGKGNDVSASIIEYYCKIAESLTSLGHISSVERTFLRAFLDILDSLASSEVVFKKERSVYSVIRSAISSAMVPFRGEPLEGIQIMGVLETRALDFERIIFLSFNDGIYPSSGERSSCIPYILRKGFGLPTYENDNSISSYNFYRLIQRASDVYMIYDTANADSMRSKEESRFLKQLRYGFGVNVKVCEFRFPTPSNAMQFTGDIQMNDKDRMALSQYFSDLSNSDSHKSFSASTLNSYINCPRQFFFSKIMRIREEDELSDDVDAAGFGSVFHNCMEKIYKPFEGSQINTAIMEKIISEVKRDAFLDNLISKAFEEELLVRRIDGKNLVTQKSIDTYIMQTLMADKSKAENSSYTLIENEHKIVEVLGERFFNSCFTGFIDRLENIGGVPRICDYKTGTFLELKSGLAVPAFLESNGFENRNIKPHYLPFKYLEDDLDNNGDNKFELLLDKMFSVGQKREKYSSVLFQMFVYTLLYKTKNGPQPYYDISVYQLKLMNKCGPVTIRITEDQLCRFSERLIGLLAEIRALADGTASAVRICESLDNCNFCAFNKYCRRVKDEN